MDKLQPLIKHRYWICFGLAVMFVVVGWWMASGAIAVEILARKDSVEKSFDKAKQGTNEPNVFWVEQARKENEADSAAYKSASAQLLQRQKDARRWPDVLASDMKGVAYRGDIKNSTTRGRWASIYRNEIERLLSIVKPYKNGEGLVVVDVNKITHKPFNSWRTAYPSSTEVWDAQEDIWLLQSLLTSIARVNEGATRITESQVRQIFKLTLRGGDRNATPASSGGGMGGMGGMSPDMMGGMGGMGMVMGGPGGDGGGGMGGGMGQNAGSHPGKEFEGNAGADILSEEFGSAGNAAGGMGGMGGMGGSMMGSGMVMGMDSMGSGGGMPGTGAPAEEKRYVDDGAELGYKTRAFLLDVIIRDDQLPNLLASLTNSDFPVEIVRVDISSKMGPQRSGGGMGGAPGMDGGLMTGTGIGEGEMAASSFGMEGGIGMPGLSEGEFGGDAGGLVMPGDGSFDAAYSGGPGGGLMMPGMDGMAGGVGGMGNRGKDVLQVAMSDPLLIHVKIGGLMTLYQSAQEADAEAATAETDQAQAPAPAAPVDETAGAVDENGQPVEPGASPTDPNMTQNSDAPSAEPTDPAAAPSETPESTEAPVPANETATEGEPAAEGEPSASAPESGEGDATPPTDSTPAGDAPTQETSGAGSN